MQKEKFEFEKSFKEIEEITSWFEGSNLDLQEGMKKFKRGMELVKQCQDELKKVENQMIEIEKEVK